MSHSRHTKPINISLPETEFGSHKLVVRFPGSQHDVIMPRPFFGQLSVNLIGHAEAQTLKLDFVVKKWQNQKNIFGILIYALCRFQNHRNPVGRIDTLTTMTVQHPGPWPNHTVSTCADWYVLFTLS